jgi:hypothetical protein
MELSDVRERRQAWAGAGDAELIDRMQLEPKERDNQLNDSGTSRRDRGFAKFRPEGAVES